jgi:hypothetical protein
MTSPDAPIEIVSCDAVWPTRFEVEAALLGRQLTPWLVGACREATVRSGRR